MYQNKKNMLNVPICLNKEKFNVNCDGNHYWNICPEFVKNHNDFLEKKYIWCSICKKNGKDDSHFILNCPEHNGDFCGSCFYLGHLSINCKNPRNWAAYPGETKKDFYLLDRKRNFNKKCEILCIPVNKYKNKNFKKINENHSFEKRIEENNFASKTLIEIQKELLEAKKLKDYCNEKMLRIQEVFYIFQKNEKRLISENTELKENIKNLLSKISSLEKELYNLPNTNEILLSIK